MGVLSLWELLKEAPALQVNLSSDEWQHRVIAVDLSIVIMEAKTLFGSVQQSHQNHAALNHGSSMQLSYLQRTRPYLWLLWHRTMHLLKAGVKVLCVADGQPPSQKQRNRTAGNVNTYTAGNNQRSGGGWWQLQVNECAHLLQQLGVPFIQLIDGEAEAYCAALNAADLCYAVMTRDSDAFAFNCKHLLRDQKLTSTQMTATMYTADSLHKHLDLSHHKLVALACLLRSDYSNGVEQVGVKKLSKFLDGFDDDTVLDEIRAIVSSQQNDAAGANAATPVSHVAQIDNYNADYTDAQLKQLLLNAGLGFGSRKKAVQLATDLALRAYALKHDLDLKSVINPYAKQRTIKQSTDEKFRERTSERIRQAFDSDVTVFDGVCNLYLQPTFRPTIDDQRAYLKAALVSHPLPVRLDKLITYCTADLQLGRLKSFLHCVGLYCTLLLYAKQDTPSPDWSTEFYEPVNITKQRTIRGLAYYDIRWQITQQGRDLLDLPRESDFSKQRKASVVDTTTASARTDAPPASPQDSEDADAVDDSTTAAALAAEFEEEQQAASEPTDQTTSHTNNADTVIAGIYFSSERVAVCAAAIADLVTAYNVSIEAARDEKQAQKDALKAQQKLAKQQEREKAQSANTQKLTSFFQQRKAAMTLPPAFAQPVTDRVETDDDDVKDNYERELERYISPTKASHSAIDHALPRAPTKPNSDAIDKNPTGSSTHTSQRTSHIAVDDSDDVIEVIEATAMKSTAKPLPLKTATKMPATKTNSKLSRHNSASDAKKPTAQSNTLDKLFAGSSVKSDSKKVCPVCAQSISSSLYNAHVNRCLDNPTAVAAKASSHDVEVVELSDDDEPTIETQFTIGALDVSVEVLSPPASSASAGNITTSLTRSPIKRSPSKSGTSSSPLKRQSTLIAPSSSSTTRRSLNNSFEEV